MKLERVHWRRGVRHAQAVISLIANTTALACHTFPTGRTGVIRRIHIFNHAAAANTVVQIGTGTAPFVSSGLEYFLVAGQDLEITEDQIPELEFTANITVQATVAAAAPSNVTVVMEVEEYMGPSA